MAPRSNPNSVIDTSVAAPRPIVIDVVVDVDVNAMVVDATDDTVALDAVVDSKVVVDAADASTVVVDAIERNVEVKLVEAMLANVVVVDVAVDGGSSATGIVGSTSHIDGNSMLLGGDSSLTVDGKIIKPDGSDAIAACIGDAIAA